MKLTYNNIFITGANGWLGKSLVQTLINGDADVLSEFEKGDYNVHSFVFKNKHTESFTKDSSNTIFEGNLCNENDCNQFLSNASEKDLLIHTAGVIHPNSVSDFFKINVQGTKNIVESAIKKGVSKIIVISSNSPIGCNASNHREDLFDEESPYNPYMGYGKSKMLMEKYLLSKIAEGIDITIIRPPWFYGENMPERQLTFYKMIRDGKFPFVGDGKNLRSMVHVKNLVQGIILSASNPISKGKIYWIADKTPYAMNEIISTIQNVIEELGVQTKPQKIRLPFILGQIAQAMDFVLQKLGLYVQKIHVVSELNKNIACSIKKAETELGYAPKIDLHTGTKIILKNHINQIK